MELRQLAGRRQLRIVDFNIALDVSVSLKVAFDVFLYVLIELGLVFELVGSLGLVLCHYLLKVVALLGFLK